MNIFLIGFMGCGKSTLGKKIANKMGYDFLDLDKEIEKSEDISIQELFTQEGEDYFRKLETDWLDKFDGDNYIVSLGGGTPCFNDNMKTINASGISVYLTMNTGLITHRLFHSKQKRPLIEKYKHDIEKLEDEIIKLLRARESFYNSAQITFEASNITTEKLDLLIEKISYLANSK